MTESQLRFVRDHSLDHSRGRVEQSDNEVRRKHSENHSSNHILGSMTIVEDSTSENETDPRYEWDCEETLGVPNLVLLQSEGRIDEEK